MHCSERFYAFFVDFKAAFDSIHHDLLFARLAALGVSRRFIRLLGSLYSGAKAAVWNREGVSASFDVGRGVRQGCLLSPLLFALYINALQDELPHGVLAGSTTIKTLMYADDIVITAATVGDLQRNINALQKFCTQWKLQVNLQKSKIMVFRRGGRLRVSESWTYQNVPVEVVNSYKYLGITLTSGLSFETHLRDRAAAAKMSIAVGYGSLFKLSNVPISVKYQVFQAATRSVLGYGAQVWGYQLYKTVEQVFKYFVKRIFHLPRNTPDYVIYQETAVLPVFMYTLDLHVKYLLKVMEMPANRYPKVVAREIVLRRLFWCKELGSIGERHGCMMDGDFEDRHGWKVRLEDLKEKIKVRWMEATRARALASTCRIYRLLDMDVKPINLTSKEQRASMFVLRWVCRVRGDLLKLNSRPHMPHEDEHNENCSLCNLRVPENMEHFIAICPALAEFRMANFGTPRLSHESFLGTLNGMNWLPLARFCESAWKYRAYLVQQFNWGNR